MTDITMEDSDSDSDGSEEHRVSKTDSLNRFILRDMIITTLSRGYRVMSFCVHIVCR
ncbi:MAG: hypothetical protein KH316_08150 [Firmicutes bacterium]|nr:hypothetical protein [Bacillota bacterium]